MTKLMIATPAFDPVVWLDTYRSVVCMDMCGMEVSAFCPDGHGVVKARTLIAKQAIADGVDWLLCIDSDMVVPRDGLRNLLEHGLDVCFGYYASGKGSDGETCLYEPGDSYRRRITKDELHAARDRGEKLVEVRGGGFGFVLVRASVFGRIAEPWFDYVWSYSGRKLSEDYHFSNQCRNAGIALYADTRVDCGHIRLNVK